MNFEIRSYDKAGNYAKLINSTAIYEHTSTTQTIFISQGNLQILLIIVGIIGIGAVVIIGGRRYRKRRSAQFKANGDKGSKFAIGSLNETTTSNNTNKAWNELSDSNTTSSNQNDSGGSPDVDNLSNEELKQNLWQRFEARRKDLTQKIFRKPVPSTAPMPTTTSNASIVKSEPTKEIPSSYRSMNESNPSMETNSDAEEWKSAIIEAPPSQAIMTGANLPLASATLASATPITDNIIDTFDSEMADLYRSGQEYLDSGQESMAIKSFETIIRLAEKKGEKDIAGFIKRKLEKM
jgi:hypothetical protein